MKILLFMITVVGPGCFNKNISLKSCFILRGSTSHKVWKIKQFKSWTYSLIFPSSHATVSNNKTCLYSHILVHVGSLPCNWKTLCRKLPATAGKPTCDPSRHLPLTFPCSFLKCFSLLSKKPWLFLSRKNKAVKQWRRKSIKPQRVGLWLVCCVSKIWSAFFC